MIANQKTKKSGFTLIELMVTILLASVVFLGVAVVMADGIRGYRQMLTRVHGNLANDAYVARIKFDKICRKARANSATLDTSVPSLQVLYYSTPNTTGGADDPPDMYALFYLNGTSLMLDTGTVTAGTAATTETVANSVTELQFSTTHSKSVQMVVTLNDNVNSITVTCGSIMHN